MLNDDWDVLTRFFPQQWRQLAVETKALKGLRKNKDPGNLLRTLMIHLACGYSLRETALRSRIAGIADLSDVALLKRLRKCKDWFAAMCQAMFVERGVRLDCYDGFQVRLVDATHVKEPGQTGSLWRIHYSLRLPSMLCDSFKITPTCGSGCGESFCQFSVQKGDYIIADRGYSSARGILHVSRQGGFVLVRLNVGSILLQSLGGKTFHLLKKLQSKVRVAGEITSWEIYVCDSENRRIAGRICAIHKTREAIAAAHKKLRQRASKQGNSLKPETLEFAKYVIVFTTFPEASFSAEEILEWYRVRWQIELVFKRFKQIAQLGHLPKVDEESAKAWLYGKLFVALLSEGMIEYANSISPWGYSLEAKAHSKQVA